ncbi:Transcriptional regulator [Seminavis robusta]|uniref:Transcriptional regulator n=1 Tax=Seminavis robusta TaxID=568900 RepID=A0A9N8EB03_9STRA|nr:Transcriptional regulator [Seminavis robusta]|eukprot:Sro749_g196830.1 Transcriptional regulator (539) ;mRNA; f:30864-32716
MPKRPLFQGSSTDASAAAATDQAAVVKLENATAQGVADPGINDVISGRGDTINRHPGNVHFRKLVEEKRRVYLSSHFKREKRLIAETIVAAIKSLDPPGRFLSKDTKTGLWFPIDEDRAREKASQALRENSKKIKAELLQTDDSIRKMSNHTNYNAAGVATGQHSSTGYPPSSPGKNGTAYDPHQHHYPYPPPGPGWGYPYYYGYQMPPMPPGYHPHAYPPPPVPTGPPPFYPYGPPQPAGGTAAATSSTFPGEPAQESNTSNIIQSKSTEPTDLDDTRFSRLPFQPMPEQRLRQTQQQRQTQNETHAMDEDSKRQDYGSSLKCRKIESFNEEPRERQVIKNTSTTWGGIVSAPHTPTKTTANFPDPPSPHPQNQAAYMRSPENYGGPRRMAAHPGYGAHHQQTLTVNTASPPLDGPPHQHHHYHPPEATRTPIGAKTPVAAIQDIVFHASQGLGAGLHHPLSATPSFSRSPLPANSPEAAAGDQSVPFSPIRAQQQLLENQNHPAKLPNDFSFPTMTAHSPRRFHRHALAQRSNYFV